MRRLWLLALTPAALLVACGGAPTDQGAALGEARVQARQAAARRAPARPVIVLTATDAHLLTAHDQRAASIQAPQADLLETVALAPRLIWWRLAPSRMLRADVAEQLVRDAQRLSALQAQLSTLPEPHQGRAIALLTQTREFIEAQSRSGTVDRPALGAFIRRHRVLSDQLLRDAADLRIKALHAVVEPWWASLDPAARATLRAAVIGAPADREGHPQVQYLMHALGAAGEGQRILYREGGSVEQAVAAVDDLALSVDLGVEGYADPLHLRQAPTAPGARQVLEARDLRLK